MKEEKHQIWLQPKLQNIIPRYQQRRFPKEKRKNQLKTIESNEEGQEHCLINQNAKLSLGYFEKGQEIKYDFNPVNKCVYIFLIDGNISINEIDLQERNALVSGIQDLYPLPSKRNLISLS